MTVIDDAIEQAKGLITGFGHLIDSLAALRDEGDVASRVDAPAAPPVLEVVPPPASEAEQVKSAAEGHDNSLPFKCPACGATFEEQVECTNGHQAEPTLPTADVLAGAPPAEQSPAPEPEPSNAVVETGVTPPPADPPAPVTPPDPPWPDAAA